MQKVTAEKNSGKFSELEKTCCTQRKRFHAIICNTWYSEICIHVASKASKACKGSTLSHSMSNVLDVRGYFHIMKDRGAHCTLVYRDKNMHLVPLMTFSFKGSSVRDFAVLFRVI